MQRPRPIASEFRLYARDAADLPQEAIATTIVVIATSPWTRLGHLVDVVASGIFW